MTTQTIKIEALFQTEQPADDVLAYALGLQHPRHAVLSHSARRVAPGIVSVVFEYPANLPAEIADVQTRLLNGNLPVDIRF